MVKEHRYVFDLSDIGSLVYVCFEMSSRGSCAVAWRLLPGSEVQWLQ